jgi:uncharacterized protein YecT (DUF1311 family)
MPLSMSQDLRRAAVSAFACAVIASAGGAARAEEPRPSVAQCDPAKLPVTAWDDCLRKAQADTDKGLEEALTKVKAMIDARTDLSGQQRSVLKRQISDSNDLWLRYRNHLCQNVVPILAGPKAKLYEENLGCLIDTNTARQIELEALTRQK